MKKLMIYPYDLYYEPILKNEVKLLGEYKISKLVSLRSLGMVGKVVQLTDEKLVVEKDFDNALDSVDAVLIVNTNISINFVDIIYPKIVKAVENHKEVVIGRKLSVDEHKLVDDLPIISLKGEIDRYQQLRMLDIKKSILAKINVPVIAVFGAGEYTDKFSIQMFLRKYFMEEGYRVSQIGSRNDSELYGVHPFPRELFDSGKESIMLFNRYVKSIELDEKPDVLILGIPDAILPVNDEFPCDFGVLPFEVFNAVKPDAGICTLYCGIYSKDFFDNLKICIQYRYGISIDCIAMNNVTIDKGTSYEIGRLKYITVEKKLMSSYLKENQKSEKIYSAIDKENLQEMAEYIIAMMSTNPDIQNI
ncbi:MAG: TIGR04066 family peptide maturation system protein [Acetatifactor sp.]